MLEQIIIAVHVLVKTYSTLEIDVFLVKNTFKMQIVKSVMMKDDA